MSTVRVAARVMHSMQSGAAAYVHSLQILLQADKKKIGPSGPCLNTEMKGEKTVNTGCIDHVY